jgi:tyrosine-specific transport protein
MKSKNFFYALSALIGMIVGVGIFGIPFSFAQAGILVGFFYLIFLSGVILMIHLFYGEIALRTNQGHGLVGYAAEYLGSWGKKVVGLVIIFEFYGALLAYLIAGGKFLNIILGPFLGGSDFIWTMMFFFFGSLMILAGLKMIAPMELLMSGFLLLIIAIFVVKGAPLLRLENLSVMSVNWSKFFLPYGVILFSLTGGAAIPEIRQILKGQERHLKKIIILGTLVPALFYALFALSVVGVTGKDTTEYALQGLVPYFGGSVIMLGAIFGFCAVFTSLLVIGANLKRIYCQDYRMKKGLAYFLICFVPLAGYLLGINDFILVISLIGVIAGGLEGIMTILIYRRAKKSGERLPEYNLKVSRIILFGLTLVFIFGIIYQFVCLAK